MELLNLKKMEDKEVQFQPIYLSFFEKILILLIKHEEIKGFRFFGSTFLYATYIDNTAFFLSDAKSVNNLLNVIFFWTKTKFFII